MHYAVAIVPTNWEPESSIGFSSMSYQKWHEKIEPGTRVLIYKQDPVNAIIAEAQVQDNAFVALENLPEENRSPLFTQDGNPADYALPLQVTMVYPQRHYVAQEELSRFMQTPQLDGWIPVNAEIFRALREPVTTDISEEEAER
ncbi:MAG: hypothetical protein KC496_03990 [Anaerolineae bacterium]|nr:hypothetical protein [Anaerolineae bacterium]